MPPPSDENRQLARAIADTFGGTPSVRMYFDDERTAEIPILTCTDAPQEGVNSHATLTLSDAEPRDSDGTALPFGVEIIAACGSGAEGFAHALSTCAFNVLKDGMPLFPGAVFPRVLDLYEGLSATLSHAFFTAPMLWDAAFASRRMATKTVAFLQMIPISDGEFAYLRAHGADALETVFEQAQIDLFDIHRPPVA